MPAAVHFLPTPWPYKVPPAVISAKSNDLPPTSLLPSLTKRSFLHTSTSSPSSYLSYTHPSSSTAPLPPRPSSHPSSVPGLHHSQRLLTQPLSASSSSSSKPRWFTNRVSLGIVPSSSYLDFAHYSSHDAGSAYRPSRKAWTREHMLREVYLQHQTELSQLRAERLRLDRELARKRSSTGDRAHRAQLLEWLQGPDCQLFEGAASVIRVKDRELDVLIEAGGCEEVDVEDGRAPAFLVHLQRLNAAGVHCDSFTALVKCLRTTRVEAEVPAAAAGEETAISELDPSTPTIQLAPIPVVASLQPEAEDSYEEDAAPIDLTPEPEPAAEVPAAVSSSPALTPAPVSPTAAPPALVDDEDVFVEPSTSRARMDSVISMHGGEGHARHNTVADDGSSEHTGTGLSMGSLMEKLGELEEEQEVQATRTEEPAPALAPAAPSEWEETGNDEDVAL